MAHPDTINIIAAFDMRDPAQRAALAKALERSPREIAEAELFAARKRVEWFVSANLTLAQALAFGMNRTVPAGLDAARAEALADLLAAEQDARAKVSALSASAAQKRAA